MPELGTSDERFEAHLDELEARIARMFRRATIELGVMTVVFFALLTTTVLVLPSLLEH